jgi:hypothetical protein
LTPLAQAAGENQQIPNAAMLMLFAKTDQILRSDRAQVVATFAVVFSCIFTGAACSESPAAIPADDGSAQPMLMRRTPARIAQSLFMCPEILLFLDSPAHAAIDSMLKQAVHPAVAFKS